jgi:hypothetical protein
MERNQRSLADNKIGFEVQSLVNAFAKAVFRTPEDVVRELLTNAQDACILRRVQEPGFAEPLITVSLDERARVLKVSDNGVGMTEDDLRNYFATFGASLSRSLKPPGVPDRPEALLGAYGIGTVAYFIVADEIEVVTRSIKPGSRGVRWIFRGGDHYVIEPAEYAGLGTTVSLRLKPEYADLAVRNHLRESLERLAPQLETPVQFEGDAIGGTRNRGALDAGAPPRAVTPVGGDGYSAGENGGSREDRSAAIMRVELSGNWLVRDFSEWLGYLELAYTRLSAFLLYSERESALLRMAFRPYIRTLMVGDRSSEFETVMRLARSRVLELEVRRIQLASPGFIELLGSLNPIKTMADFITSWRSENTKRQELMLAHKRALADRAAEIIKASPNEDFADRFLRFALEEPNEKLTIVARDFRLERVSWEPAEADGGSTDVSQGRHL